MYKQVTNIPLTKSGLNHLFPSMSTGAMRLARTETFCMIERNIVMTIELEIPMPETSAISMAVRWGFTSMKS